MYPSVISVRPSSISSLVLPRNTREERSVEGNARGTIALLKALHKRRRVQLAEEPLRRARRAVQSAVQEGIREGEKDPRSFESGEQRETRLARASQSIPGVVRRYLRTVAIP